MIDGPNLVSVVITCIVPQSIDTSSHDLLGWVQNNNYCFKPRWAFIFKRIKTRSISLWNHCFVINQANEGSFQTWIQRLYVEHAQTKKWPIIKYDKNLSWQTDRHFLFGFIYLHTEGRHRPLDLYMGSPLVSDDHFILGNFILYPLLYRANKEKSSIYIVALCLSTPRWS